MRITQPGDPPPNPKHRWVFPLLLLLFVGGLCTPLGVVYYHNKVVEHNQNEVIDALRKYAQLQRAVFARRQHYAAAFDELSDPDWAQVRDTSALNPTDYHGYRFRLFTSSGGDGGVNFIDKNGHMSGGYGLVAMPARYGVTGRFTFFISAPGDTLYYFDLGVKTDEAVRALDQYFVPPAAREMKGG
jgi:hypothetical protein